MNVLTKSAVAAMLVVASMGLGQASAQTTMTTSRGRVFQPQAGQTQEPVEIISVTFPGGSAAAYAKAVQDASGKKRVIVMPGCEAFQMPPVSLEGVSFEGALMPVQYARSGTPGAILQVDTVGDVYVVAPATVYSVYSTAEETQVFSLAETLEAGQVRAEDVLTAVETALNLGDEGNAAVKYHPETRLLMVRGTPDAIESVRRVLNGVMESANAMRHGADDKDQAQREMDKLRAGVDASAKEVEEAKKYAAEVDEMAKQGKMSPLDVLKAREQLIEREQKRAEMEARLRVMQERAEKAAAEESAKARAKSGAGGAAGR